MTRSRSKRSPAFQVTNILAASDLSRAADAALIAGHDWSRLHRARLAVCHVVPNLLKSAPLFPQWNRPAAEVQPEVEREAEGRLTEKMRRLTGRRPGGFEVVVAEGVPHVEILEAAEARGTDLIVVGSHGYTGLERILLGGEAERVVRYAHCPVLVARRGGRGKGGVLAATDFSPPSLHALRLAAAVALARRAPLTVLHAVEIPSPYPDVGAMSGVVDSGFFARVREQTLTDARRELEGILRRLRIPGEPLVVEGSPAPAVVKTAEELSADLIVVGTLGRTGLRRMVLGNVAERVVRSAHASVLVVR